MSDSSTTPSTMAFSSVKRSACDRCRGQKLKCPPRDSPAVPCARCVRLNAPCFTNYSKPAGRVAKQQSSSADFGRQYQPKLRPKATPPVTAPASPLATPTNEPSTSERPLDSAQQSALTPSSVFSNNNTPHIFTRSGIQATAHGDASQAMYFSPTESIFPLQQDEYNLLDDMQTESISSLMSNDAVSFDLPGMLEPTEGGNSDSHSTGGASHSKPGRDPCRASNPATSGDAQDIVAVAHEVRLSRLNLALSERHTQCMTLPDPSGRAALLGLGDGTPVRDVGSVYNLFEDAVRDLSELLAIVQIFGADHSNEALDRDGELNSHYQPRSRHRAPVDFIALLNLLSTYLQIVSIFDRIFRSLRLCSTRYPNGYADATQQPSLLGLKVAGFPAELQTKMLIHAILHQFDVIERTMGLPADLRVTGSSGIYQGLFEDNSARALLGAVSTGCMTRNSWNAQAVPDLSYPRAARSPISLREAIKDIQSLLL